MGSMVAEKFESISEVIVKYSRRPLYILISIVLIGLIAITILAVPYGISMNPPTKYLLIIDCGVSSCQFSLFEYTDWYGRSNAWIRLRSYYTIDPGAPFLIDNPNVGAETISQETEEVVTRGVPPGSQKDTRIFFGAVAGVRMLKKRNAEKVERLMAVVRNALAGLALEGVAVSRMEDVRIVSGAEEGFYAWMAVNYLMGNFGKENCELRLRPLSMLGALHLDDASTQITFALPDEEASAKSGIKATAFGHTYNLYSHSHICCGVATMRVRYLARLTEGADLQKPVVSPCHQSGLSMEVASDDIFEAPCVAFTGEDAMPQSIPKPSGVPTTIVFRGDYDANKCGLTVAEMFANGSFADVRRPRLRGDFAAIGMLWDVVASFWQANHPVRVTQTQFVTTVDGFCRRQWTSLPPQEQTTSEDKCLQGWMVKELLEAYGFRSDNDWSAITFLGSVNETAASWPTGYALEVTSRIPSTAPAIRMNLMGFIVGVAIFLNMVVMGLFLLLIRCCKKQL